MSETCPESFHEGGPCDECGDTLCVDDNGKTNCPNKECPSNSTVTKGLYPRICRVEGCGKPAVRFLRFPGDDLLSLDLCLSHTEAIDSKDYDVDSLE